MTPVLELDAVTKTYGSDSPVLALRGVGFHVDAGELVAILGPSGSGKSTLLHVMGTLERPSSGRVSITGLDVEELTDRELAAVRATPRSRSRHLRRPPRRRPRQQVQSSCSLLV